MSTNDPKFKGLLKLIDKALDKSASRLSRIRKEARVHLVIIDAREIYDEITSKYSPFKVPGRKVPDTALKPISVKIAKDLWVLFKKHATGRHFKVGEETAFMAHEGVALLFDNTQNYIYVRSSKGKNNQEVFRANAMSKVQAAVMSRPTNDPTNMFINKNPEYVREYTRLNVDLGLEFAKSEEYQRAKASPKKDAVSKKMQNIRGKRGDAFGKYPKFHWSKKFEKLFVDYPGQGTQLGHIFGGQVSVATNIVASREDFVRTESYEDIVLLDSIPATFKTTNLKKSIFKVSQSDANVVLKRTVTQGGVFGDLTIVVPELKSKNQKEGAEAQKVFNEEVVPELLKLKSNITSIKGSPSYTDLLEGYVENIFLGKKPKSKSYITKATIKRKSSNITVPVTKLSIKGSQLKTRKVNRRIKEPENNSFNLPRILSILNDRLHDAIERNMGKGRSKKILNYQTGRFARSAEVKMLYPSREKNAINAEVKYMKKPYDTFERGGKLYKVGRDPALIFGKSIRQILIEEQIAILRRVKVDLHG